MMKVPETRQVSPFLVFYLITSMQIGVGVLGFQRVISIEAGYDSWISIIAAGASIHIIVYIFYKIVQKSDGDLVSAHQIVFGKWIGNLLSTVYTGYYCLIVVTILRTYLEVVQVWMFHELSTFWFSIFFLLLVVYIVNGGIRTVAGVSFFGTVLPSYLALMFGFTVPYAEYRNLLPLFDHSFKELLSASFAMSLTFLGYEIILMIYPMIKNGKHSQKWAHLGVFMTTLFYTIAAIATFTFFTEEQLSRTIWATLSTWKIVKMPFVERFEFIGIANWNLIILPNVCIALWCGSRILKRSYGLKQRKGVLLFAAICVASLPLFETRQQINMLNDITGKVGFALNYGYFPLLLILLLIMRKVRKLDKPKKESSGTESNSRDAASSSDDQNDSSQQNSPPVTTSPSN
ncbi:GerAB/ArcD/ProY family transporter [Bacillus fonticola]|uniref:GerAB/ArcD/ProY family transporter n=1 Tax=Bacillus fonticola TaxID=2728853 RepID=UPI001474736A|nr:GerAB/ArcD/ProY family transporter [Bacillus fonticola]